MHIYQRTNSNKKSELSITSPVLNRALQNRGIENDSELQLELKNLLPPNTFTGLDKAVSLLIPIIKSGKRIVVVGDFDVDGATSCTLSILGFNDLGVKEISYLVPDRFKYGYGLTPEIVELALKKKPDIIITVDNGVSSIEGVKAANEAGVPVLVTDHHLPGKELPDAAAILNPNLKDNHFGSKNLAGVGVLFYLLLGLRSALREVDYFKLNKIPDPNFANYLDLLALGTVADVVPLDFNNRILVSQGLKRIQNGQCRPGIKALLKIANRDIAFVNAADMGFALGPRLNAAGRLDDMSVGIQCLLAETESIAMGYATQLDELNKLRREIEADMQAEAMHIIENNLVFDNKEIPYGLCLFDQHWHQGVIGILASRLKEKFHRPTIIFAPGDIDELKGSCRSISGLHIRDALDEVATMNPGLIHKFGGHAMAAGLSISSTDFDQFSTAFNQVVQKQLSEEQLEQAIYTDGVLEKEDLTLKLAEDIAAISPWGQSFPEPLFDNNFQIIQQRIVGEKHWKLVLKIENTNELIDAIAFNQVENFPSPLPEKLRFIYHLDINRFRGNCNLQLMVRHMVNCNDE